QERLAKLAGGVAVVKVGAATETELKERKLRLEDALNSTRAAVEEGIVSGGGTALMNIYKQVAELSFEYDDETTGANIVLRALEDPVGHNDDHEVLVEAVVVERLIGEAIGIGLDAAKSEGVNIEEAEIIDPTKLTRSPLQHATTDAPM